jgi:peptide deformylase
MKLIIEKGKRQQILHQVCQTVSPDEWDDWHFAQKLAKGLVATLQKHPEARGIAAPQVGSLLRVIAVRTGKEFIQVLVNPTVKRLVGWRMVEEGCLSLPKRTFLVKRAQVVTVRGLSPETGGNVTITASGNEVAQALEHEIEHLDGILLTDKGKERLSNEKIIDPWSRK